MAFGEYSTLGFNGAAVSLALPLATTAPTGEPLTEETGVVATLVGLALCFFRLLLARFFVLVCFRGVFFFADFLVLESNAIPNSFLFKLVGAILTGKWIRSNSYISYVYRRVQR